MKVGAGILGGESADVVGDVKIKSVSAGAVNLNVLGIRSECLEGTSHL